VIDRRHLRATPLFDAVGCSSVPRSRSTQIADYFGSEQEIAIVLNDNRVRQSIADIRMGAAGLFGLAADTCSTDRLPSDPANAEELFSVVDSSQSDAFALRIELRGFTGLVVPLIGGPAGDSDLDHRLPSDPQADMTVAFRGQSRLSRDYQSK
jgi:hypothetical protein